jgi:RNA polymerase sigma-70 factor (ECF subfamily)
LLEKKTGFAAGWPARMSKPFAAKGLGACLKHVSTPGSAGRASREERLVDVSCEKTPDRLPMDRYRPARRRCTMRMIATDFDRLPAPRLRDCDPLPPADRAAPPDHSLDALYREHAARLLRFFSRRAGTNEAPDLVHEAFVRMAGTDPGFAREIDSPGAYLTRIATNLLRDRAKMAVRRSAAFHSSYDDEEHSGVDPHQLLDHREKLAKLDAGVQRLNRRTRQIFLLHRVEGLTYAQIAEETGMSVKGVKKQMMKALLHLRRDVGPL